MAAYFEERGRKSHRGAMRLRTAPAALVISPYAKTNFVDNTLTDQSSILRFIEDNWSTGRIGGGSFDAIGRDSEQHARLQRTSSRSAPPAAAGSDHRRAALKAQGLTIRLLPRHCETGAPAKGLRARPLYSFGFLSHSERGELASSGKFFFFVILSKARSTRSDSSDAALRRAPGAPESNRCAQILRLASQTCFVQDDPKVKGFYAWKTQHQLQDCFATGR